MKTSSKHPIYQSNPNAFTLVELVVTISILSILASISIASYFNIINNQAMRSGSIATAEWLDNIRKRALQTNKPCEVSISANGKIMSPGSNNQCGDFAVLSLEDVSTYGPKPSFCYAPTEPLTSTITCGPSTATSEQSITFSPRGTTLQSGIFAFKTDSLSARYCTIVYPLALIRNGRLDAGICNTNT